MTGTDPSSTDAGADDRATPLRVVGLLMGLLLIGGAAASLLRPRGAELVPGEALADLFAAVEEDPGAGFASVEARRLPAGETLVRFTGGESPIELLLVRYPRSRADAVLEDQFRSLRFDDGGGHGGGRGGPPGGHGGHGGHGGDGPKLRDAGVLDWHGLEARYARLRHPVDSGAEEEGDEEPGGASEERGGAPGPTYDTIRVNLTTPQQCLVAYARFGPGAEATPGAVGQLLSRFRPLE